MIASLVLCLNVVFILIPLGDEFFTKRVQEQDTTSSRLFEPKIEVHGLNHIDQERWERWVADWSSSMSPQEMREALINYAWIKDARIVRRQGKQILIFVEENEPIAIQFDAGSRHLLFADGRRETMIAHESMEKTLPRIYGSLERNRAQDIPLLMTYLPQEMAPVSTLIRVDRRRWNVVTKDSILIKLGTDLWLERKKDLDLLVQAGLMTLHRHQGIREVDLRVPDVVIVRQKERFEPG